MENNKIYELTPEWAGKLKFSIEDLVDLFLNNNQRWFESGSGNLLEGKRDQCRSGLIDAIKTGVHPARTDYDVTYVLYKFKNEWLGPDGIFKPIQ